MFFFLFFYVFSILCLSICSCIGCVIVWTHLLLVIQCKRTLQFILPKRRNKIQKINSRKRMKWWKGIVHFIRKEYITVNGNQRKQRKKNENRTKMTIQTKKPRLSNIFYCRCYWCSSTGCKTEIASQLNII